VNTLEITLGNARKLVNESMFSQAVEEYGKVVEWLFKKLYREYLPQLSYSEKQKVIDFEKHLQKSVDKFTIGEWTGLFRESHLFNIIENDKREERGFVFFTQDVITAVNELRNRCTHPSEDSRGYEEKHVASFVESAVVGMLKELGMMPKIETIYPSATERGPSFGKHFAERHFAEVSKDDVLRAARDPRIRNFRWVSKYVEIEGERYPVKGLLSIASGVSTDRFTTDIATRVIEKLGFKVMSSTA